ncbi:MAG: PLP-dependent aminotransferase family protein [Oceanicoccus sp.]
MKKILLYQELIDYFEKQIRLGDLEPGSRMPSIRKLCHSHKISKSTVLSAYGYLESQGVIESRSRSGYFVRTLMANTGQHTTNFSGQSAAPALVTPSQFVIQLMERGAAFDLIPSNNTEEDNVELRRCLARACREQTGKEQSYYDSPQGLVELRDQISRRQKIQGSPVQSQDITITSGCQNSLLIALMATTTPGDIVAVESPGFYGAIQVIQALGLQILELPGNPYSGINIESTSTAFNTWNVKALFLSSNYSTPTGACLSDADKQALLSLCIQHNVTIIEDDIYGELSFELNRPRTLYSMDTTGAVILCSSFSKSLSRDLRIGWIASSKHKEVIRRLKVVTTLSVSKTAQQGLADYMSRGLFERHIRKKRILLANQCKQLQQLLHDELPAGTSWTSPKGGLSLWLMLPEHVDTTSLYSKALEQGVTITPGILFSAQNKYQNCMRISFTHQWMEERVRAIKILGGLID